MLNPFADANGWLRVSVVVVVVVLAHARTLSPGPVMWCACAESGGLIVKKRVPKASLSRSRTRDVAAAYLCALIIAFRDDSEPTRRWFGASSLDYCLIDWRKRPKIIAKFDRV